MAKAIVSGVFLLALVGCGSSGGASDAGSGGNGGSGGSGGAGGTSGATGNGGTGGLTDGGASSCAPAHGIDGGTTSVGTLSWRDNGTLQCATLVLTARQTGTAADEIEIDASTALTSVNLVVSTYSPPLGGTYTCHPASGTTPIVRIEIIGLESSLGAASSCTITIGFTTDGTGTQHAQGTFSGTLTGDGGTDVITDGMFDVTVAPQGG